MIKYIHDTQFARISDYDGNIKHVTSFLINNRSLVLPPQALDQIYQVKPYAKTIMNDLFDRLLNTGYIDEFAAILPIESRNANITPELNIPEILTAPSLVIDFKTNKYNAALSSFYELKNKLLVNLASIVKRNDRTYNLMVSDINELHSMYVRAMLTRSYSVSDGWLTPNLANFIIKTYALSLATLIGKSENLAFQEQMTVALVLALYMSQQFARSDENPARPRIFYKCTYLGSISDLNNLLGRAEELAPQGLTLTTACQLISELGPQRLKKFNVGTLYRLGVRLFSTMEPLIPQIGLEYAPYFTYMILSILAGGKGGSLQLCMKENRLLGSESKHFMEELKVCQSLFANR